MNRLRKSKKLVVFLLVVASLIISVGFGQSVYVYQPLDPDLVGKNCTVDQLSTMGQGYQYNGSNGGFIQLPDNHVSNSRTNFRFTTLQNITTSLSSAGYQYLDIFDGTQNVVILVVDNFELNTGQGFSGIQVLELRDEVFDLPPEVFGPEGPSLSPEQRVRRVRPIFDNIKHAISHGALVRNHINTVFEQMSVAPTSFFEQVGTGENRTEDIWGNSNSNNNATITIKPIDISGVDTQVIANTLRTELAIYERQNIPVVVNMSFSLVPCGLKNAVEQGQFSTYDEYSKLVMEQDGVSMGELWGAIEFSIRNTLDPLLELISEKEDNEKLVFVSSAGNFGMNFPLLPAAFKRVHSVSATDPEVRNTTFYLPPFEPTKKDWSNSGQLMTDGSFYLLHDAVRPLFTSTPRQHNNVPLYYAGTSYAGPNISILMALNLSQQSPLCSNQDLLRTFSSPNNIFVLDAFSACSP